MKDLNEVINQIFDDTIQLAKKDVKFLESLVWYTLFLLLILATAIRVS